MLDIVSVAHVNEIRGLVYKLGHWDGCILVPVFLYSCSVSGNSGGFMKYLSLTIIWYGKTAVTLSS